MNNEVAVLAQITDVIWDKIGMDITFKAHGKGRDGGYDLVVQGRAMHFYLEFKTFMAVYHVDEIAKKKTEGRQIMVIAEQIAAPAREQLRKKGIPYLEANGNAFIQNGQTTLFLDGNKPVRQSKPVANRAFTKTGLKAVFHLLNDPAAITRTYRQ